MIFIFAIGMVSDSMDANPSTKYSDTFVNV